MATIERERDLRGGNREDHACVEACVGCLVACETRSDACLGEDDVGTVVRSIRLDRDCADACAAAVRAMVRGGSLARELCRACAEACRRCEAECRPMAA